MQGLSGPVPVVAMVCVCVHVCDGGHVEEIQNEEL